MTNFNRAFPILSISASLMGSTAWAELAPNDLWDVWKTSMTSLGYEVTATEEESGDTLVVKDITAKMTLPEGMEGTAQSTVSELTFKANGDGTVSLICPDVIKVTSMSDVTSTKKADAGEGSTETQDDTQKSANDADAVPTDQASGEKHSTKIGMEISCAEMQMTASGTPGEIEFDYSGPTMAAKLLEFDTATDEADIELLEVTLNGVEGHDVYKIGDRFMSNHSVSAKELVYNTKMKTVKADNDLTLTSTLSDVSIQTETDYPNKAVFDDMSDMNIAATLEYGSEKSEFSSSVPLKGGTKSSLGLMAFAFKNGVLKGDFKAQDIAVTVTEGAPVPVEVTLKEYDSSISLPLVASEDSQDFGYGMTIRELSVPDFVWGMFDPGQKLPHDPLTLAFDITGKGKLSTDFTNITDLAKAEGDNAKLGDLETVSLNSLTIDALGAELSGDGTVDFELPDGEKQPPNMDGEFDFKLVGSSALIDKLTEAGLLPQEKAMGLRMMLGLFAVANDEPDTLTSKIEFNPSGEILANGQRIK